MVSWEGVPESFRSGAAPLPVPWEDLFGPLRALGVDDIMVIGQLGQSLDGRVATPTGHSHYINGPAGLNHLHRLRALVDAVVVGIGTAVADDPQLTVRRVSGPQPVRVVIDPKGRLPGSARLLTNDGVRRIILTASGVRPSLPQGVEIVELPAPGGQIAPSAILASAQGARPQPDPDRRRRRHGFAVLGRRLSRPAACGRSTHRARFRTRGAHAAADRARRSGVARADACAPPRRRGAVRLRSVGSARSREPRPLTGVIWWRATGQSDSG